MAIVEWAQIYEHLYTVTNASQKLQRAIAEFRGFANDRPLKSPLRDAAYEHVPKPDVTVQSYSSKESASATTTEQKRKYRRHPKSDENAPEKPPSAYVLFSNRVREEVKAESLSFIEIARLVGERWQKLDPNQKELFESHASTHKDNYSKELADYKKTDAYNEYIQYLADFKAKNAQSDAKRPKLEHQGSSSLSGNSVGDPTELLAHQIPRHARRRSIGSASASSQAGSSVLPLVTAISGTNASIGQRGSPLYQYPQERRLIGQLSGESSISEDPSTPRFDSSEAPSRTATLSSGTPPRATPSPSGETARSGRRDYAQGTGSQQWPNQHAPYSFSAAEAATTSPSSTPSSITARQDRRAEARFYTGGPSVLAHQTSSVPISLHTDPHLKSDSGNAISQRILPPIRQITGTTSAVSVTGLAAQSTPNAFHPYHSTNEQMAFRQGPIRYTPNQSESEAADTLAALAEREHSFSQSRTPKAWQN